MLLTVLKYSQSVIEQIIVEYNTFTLFHILKLTPFYSSSNPFILCIVYKEYSVFWVHSCELKDTVFFIN